MLFTTTCLIHIGICLSDKYLANSNMFLFDIPVSFLCSSSLMCFISSKTKSVYFKSASILFVLFGLKRIPEVSSAVWIFFSFACLNNSVTNSIWRSGSPPVTVIPPLLTNSLIPSYFSSISSTDIFLFVSVDQLSGLWQYLHLNGQPCIKTTKRIPGPSTVPQLSMEWIFP